jgi:hypothetical protein
MKLPYLNKPPNNSHRQLVIGVPKLTIVQVIQQEDKLWDEWTLHHRQRSYQEQKRESKDPDIEEALSQWSNVEKKIRS